MHKFRLIKPYNVVLQRTFIRCVSYWNQGIVQPLESYPELHSGGGVGRGGGRLLYPDICLRVLLPHPLSGREMTSLFYLCRDWVYHTIKCLCTAVWSFALFYNVPPFLSLSLPHPSYLYIYESFENLPKLCRPDLWRLGTFIFEPVTVGKISRPKVSILMGPKLA